jgi:putative membrane protein
MTANPSEPSDTATPPTVPAPPTSDELRTFLAGQRTVLAWIRTALALMGFGFLVARFGLFLRHLAAIDRQVNVHTTGFSLWMGTSLVLVGVIVNVYAAMRHRHFARHFRSELSQTHHSLFEIALALFLALLGLTMAAYLVIVEH